MDVIGSFNNLLKNFSNFKSFKDIIIEKEEDIQKIPITTRKDLEKYSITDCPIIPESVHTTSGSTGKNLFIFHSKESNDFIRKRVYIPIRTHLDDTDMALNLFEYGLSISGIQMDIALRECDIPIIPFGVPNKGNINIIIDSINKIKPTAIICTPSVLYELKNALLNSSINTIFCWGSLITPEFRTLIYSTCNKEIIDGYGCNEVGPISIQKTPKDKMQLLLGEGLYIEVLKDDGSIANEGIGKILITDLHNFSMPIIRYLLGDKVEIKKINKEKMIRVLGRDDKYTNIDDSVFSINLIIKTCLSILSHDKFAILIRKNKPSWKDIVYIHLPPENEKDIKHLKEAYNTLGLSPQILIKDKIQITSSGKFINFIDLRKLDLEDRKLNW